MLVAFALAIGTLGPASDLRLIDVDCVKAEKIEPAKPYPRKHVIVKHKRLFKAEPKPVIEPNCDETPPGPITTYFPSAPDEPPGEFTPPPETFAAPQTPGEREPGIPDTSGSATLGAAFITYAIAGPCCYCPPTSVIAAPVPEPSTALLLLVSLGAWGWVRGRSA